jgi:hypothetical protein
VKIYSYGRQKFMAADGGVVCLNVRAGGEEGESRFVDKVGREGGANSASPKLFILQQQQRFNIQYCTQLQPTTTIQHRQSQKWPNQAARQIKASRR